MVCFNEAFHNLLRLNRTNFFGVKSPLVESTSGEMLLLLTGPHSPVEMVVVDPLTHDAHTPQNHSQGHRDEDAGHGVDAYRRSNTVHSHDFHKVFNTPNTDWDWYFKYGPCPAKGYPWSTSKLLRTMEYIKSFR